MKFDFVVDNGSLALVWDRWISQRRPAKGWCAQYRDSLNDTAREQYDARWRSVPVPSFADMTTHAWVEDQESLFGISSVWTITDIGDGRWYVEFAGPRHSLHDWLPGGLLDLAHEHWLRGEFGTYESQRTDVGPRAIGLAPHPPHEAWVWDDPDWDGVWLDGHTRRGQAVTEGAFGQNY